MDPTERRSADEQLAKRREINRKAARKSRRKEKEYAESVRQTYFEAQSRNTTLTYQKKQLEKRKETLTAQWSSHQAICPHVLTGSIVQQLGTETTTPSTTPYRRVLSAPESTPGPSGCLPLLLSVTVANENPACPQPQLLPIVIDSVQESSDYTGDAVTSRSLSCPAKLLPPSSTQWSLPIVWDSNADGETSADGCPEMVSSQSLDSCDSQSSSSSVSSTKSMEALNESESSGAVGLPLSERDGGGLSLLTSSNNSQDSVFGTTSLQNATTMPPKLVKIHSFTPTDVSFRSADHVNLATLLMTSGDVSFVGDPVPETRTDPNSGGSGLGEVEQFNDDRSNLSFSSSSFQTNVEYERAGKGCSSTAVDYGPPSEGDPVSPLVTNPDDVTDRQQVDASPTADYDDQIPIHVRNMISDK